MGATSRKKRGSDLSDMQSALAEYAAQQVRRGRALAEVVVELQRGGCAEVSMDALGGWMKLLGKEVEADDPLAGELDEDRRAARLEELYVEAAESVPGAAELLGVDRLRAAVVCSADLGGAAIGGVAGLAENESMAEVVRKCLDFLVPEIATERYRIVNRLLTVPHGHRWELWVAGDRVRGESLVMRSTIVFYDDAGAMVRMENFTRPRGRVREQNRTRQLPVRQAQLCVQADLRAVAQRLMQVALEFRPGRHERISQKELADLCDRTKQAISHQRGLFAKRVLVATGGRAGFRGRRNLR